MKAPNGKRVTVTILMVAVLILLSVWFSGDRFSRPIPSQPQHPSFRIPFMRLLSYQSCRAEIPGVEGACFSDVRLAADFEKIRLYIPRVFYRGDTADALRNWRFQTRGEDAKIESCSDSLRRALQNAGIHDPMMRFSMTGAYDRHLRLLHIERFHLSVHGQFVLEISGTINDFDVERALMQPADLFYWLSVIPRASLDHANLSYQDIGLARRIIERNAEKTDAFQRRLEKWITQPDAATPGHPGGLSASSAQALSRFLSRPTGLTAAIAPAQPIPALGFLQEDYLKKIIALLELEYKPGPPL